MRQLELWPGETEAKRQHRWRVAPELTEEVLKRLYWGEGLSTSEIGERFGVHGMTVRQRMIRCGIRRRTAFELARRQENHVEVTPAFREFLDASLIGDGALYPNSPQSARFHLTSKHQAYASWIAEQVQGFGCRCPPPRYQLAKLKYKGRVVEADTWKVQSGCYVELYDEYRRWYPDGKKRVPRDIELTPTVLRQWLMDDGTYGMYGRSGRSPVVMFATCGLPVEDVLWLIEQLRGLGFDVSHQPANNLIRIKAASVSGFFDYVGDCPEELKDVFGYKWPRR